MSSPSSISSGELHDIDWETEPFFDYVDPLTASPAHRAVINNDVTKLQELANEGHSLNVNDNEGSTPLHLAITNKSRRECFDFLVNHKDTRLDVTNFAGKTPLFLAILNDDPHYAISLIRKGADVNVVDLIGQSPLNLTSNVLVVQELILKGADINNTDKMDNYTPIFNAIKQKRLDIFDCLLFYGGDVTIPDARGLLPFFYSPPEIEETMFELTFDGLELYKVNLSGLIQLIAKESPFFYPLLEKCSGARWNPVARFSWRWTVFDNDHKIKMVLSLLNKFRCIGYKAIQMFNPIRELPKNMIEVVYALDGSYVSDAMIKNFIESDCSKEYLLQVDCMEFILYLASKGVPITEIDMDFIYKRHGFSEVFEMLLYIEIEPVSRLWGRYARHIYDPNYSVLMDTTSHSMRKILNKFFHQDTSLPSLLELSREVARGHLISTFNLTNNVKFFTFLKRLPILQVYKDILSYKREIYR